MFLLANINNLSVTIACFNSLSDLQDTDVPSMSSDIRFGYLERT